MLRHAEDNIAVRNSLRTCKLRSDIVQRGGRRKIIDDLSVEAMLQADQHLFDAISKSIQFVLLKSHIGNTGENRTERLYICVIDLPPPVDSRLVSQPIVP